jgi:hypothetical protein
LVYTLKTYNAKLKSSALKQQKMNEEQLIAEFKLLAIRFIDLPDFLQSPHKSRRQYGHRVLNNVAIPRLNELTLCEEQDYDCDLSDENLEFISNYFGALAKGDYNKARKVAYNWLRSLNDSHAFYK